MAKRVGKVARTRVEKARGGRVAARGAGGGVVATRNKAGLTGSAKRDGVATAGNARVAGVDASVDAGAKGGQVATVKVRCGGVTAFRAQVLIGHGLIGRGHEQIARAMKGRRGVLIVADSGLPEGDVRRLREIALGAGARVEVCGVEASESEKSLATLERVLARAAGMKLERADCVVGLGGGVVTDVAGFAAAVYRRGVEIVQFPSSLLAMVDAAVGGKTGVNLRVGGAGVDGAGGSEVRLLKNMVGAFHPARLVVCDCALLASLPERELRCGLGECVKHALIGRALGDAKLWAWLQGNAEGVLRLEPATLVELIKRNVACKARVVERDEREMSASADGGRMMLNLGHTFAHAIETLPGLSWRDGESGETQRGPLKHGEAVGLGLVCATVVSEHLGLMVAKVGTLGAVSSQVVALLRKVGLPTSVAGLPAAAEVARRMMDDKKVSGGRMRLIVPTTGGGCRVVDDVAGVVVRRGIEAINSSD